MIVHELLEPRVRLPGRDLALPRLPVALLDLPRDGEVEQVERAAEVEVARHERRDRAAQLHVEAREHAVLGVLARRGRVLVVAEEVGKRLRDDDLLARGVHEGGVFAGLQGDVAREGGFGHEGAHGRADAPSVAVSQVTAKQVFPQKEEKGRREGVLGTVGNH